MPTRFALLLLLAAGSAECAAPPAAARPAVGDTDWELYGSRLRAAYRAWELGRPGEAWRELEDCRWDLRGWEHRHLCALLMRHQAILTREGADARFAPDGRLVVRGRKGFRVHDGRTFEPIAGEALRIHEAKWPELRPASFAHKTPLTALEASPDGARVASGAKDGTLAVWDARTGKKSLDLAGHAEEVYGIAFSPDGSRLVSASLRLIRVWEARTGRVIASRDANNVTKPGVAISPDGRRVLSASDEIDTALLWDADTGRELRRFRVKGPNLSRVAFRPDGLALATGHTDGTIRLWEARTGKRLETFLGHAPEPRGRDGGIMGLSFSPEGARLLSCGSDLTVRMWDARANPVPAKYYTGLQNAGVQNRILSVSGSRFVNLSFPWPHLSNWASPPHLSGHVIASGRRLYEYDSGRENGPRCFAVSPDGKFLATGSPWGIVCIRDGATGLPLHTHFQHLLEDVDAVAWSPGGRRIASATRTGSIRVWEASSGKHVRFLSGPKDLVWLAYSPDGTLLACVGQERGASGGEIRVFDAKSGALRYAVSDQLPETRAGFAFSPDGTKFLYGTYHELKVRDARNGRLLPSIEREPADSPAQDLAYSPDGTRLITWDHETLHVREGRSGRILLSLPVEGRNAFAFAPDGRLYSAGGLSQPPLREERAGHDARVLQKSDLLRRSGLSSNPDGSVIAYHSGGPDVMAWDAGTGNLLLHALLDEQHDQLWFTPDGKTLAALSLTDPNGPQHAWVVRPGGKVPNLTDPLDRPVAPKLVGGYHLEERRGRIALIHASEPAEDRAPMARWAEPDIAWHRSRLADATMDGDDSAAEFHIRRLLRDPLQRQDTGLHVHLAHILAGRAEPREASASLAWALLLNPRIDPWPTCDDLWDRTAEAAKRGEWDRAVRGYRLLIPWFERMNDSEDLLSWVDHFSLSLVLAEVAAGVPTASRHRLREANCHRLYPAPLRQALCLPNGPAAIRALHMSALADQRSSPPPIGLGRLGAAQYRMGRDEDAARTLARAAGAPEKGEEAFIALFQSLAAKRLGRDAEAKAALARAEASRKARFPEDWCERVALDALFTEARAALAAPPRMPRVPDGE